MVVRMMLGIGRERIALASELWVPPSGGSSTPSWDQESSTTSVLLPVARRCNSERDGPPQRDVPSVRAAPSIRGRRHPSWRTLPRAWQCPSGSHSPTSWPVVPN
jgi:hypothetical protein